MTDDSQKHLRDKGGQVNDCTMAKGVCVCLCSPPSLKVACRVGRDAIGKREALWVVRWQLSELQRENLGVEVPHHHVAQRVAKEGGVRLRARLAPGPLLGERHKLHPTQGKS